MMIDNNLSMTTKFQLLLLITCIGFVSALLPKLASGSFIGVSYGTLGDNLPSPSEVVAMYQERHIGRMRIYEPYSSVLEALRGSGIQVLVGVRNEDLQELASSYTAATNWVENNINTYLPDVHFRYISVGNEVIPGSLAQFVLPAMQNLHNALRVRDLWHGIKVSTSVATSVMDASYPPSSGAFANSSVDYMGPIARYLDSIGAPLLANVYPYFSYISDPGDISLSYALFNSPSIVFSDIGGLGYRNLFDAIVDALHASLEKVGAAKVPVVVSETGWPNAGDGSVASIKNARCYNSNLIRHVLLGRGTPRWPEKPIETYLFSMFNENRKQGAMVEQHWGLFYPDKRAVYPIDFM